MSTHVLLVDLLGLVFVLVGFHLVFRQRIVRKWIDAGRASKGRAPMKRTSGGDDEDPLHYAMLIFGTMMMAFGTIIFGFTTMYAIVT